MGSNVDLGADVHPGDSAFSPVEEAPLRATLATIFSGASDRRITGVSGKVNILYADTGNTEIIYIGIDNGGWLPIPAGGNITLEANRRLSLSDLYVQKTTAAQKLTILSFD